MSQGIFVRSVRVSLSNPVEVRRLFAGSFPEMESSALEQVMAGVCCTDKAGGFRMFQAYSLEMRQETWITADHSNAMAITIANIDEIAAIRVRNAHAALGKSGAFSVDAVAAVVSDVVGVARAIPN